MKGLSQLPHNKFCEGLKAPTIWVLNPIQNRVFHSEDGDK